MHSENGLSFSNRPTTGISRMWHFADPLLAAPWSQSAIPGLYAILGRTSEIPVRLTQWRKPHWRSSPFACSYLRSSWGANILLPQLATPFLLTVAYFPAARIANILQVLGSTGLSVSRSASLGEQPEPQGSVSKATDFPANSSFSPVDRHRSGPGTPGRESAGKLTRRAAQWSKQSA
jgi:hypothetical protein